jgi:hypothetical protein
MMAGVMHVDDALDVTNGFQSQSPFRFGADGTQPAENRF